MEQQLHMCTVALSLCLVVLLHDVAMYSGYAWPQSHMTASRDSRGPLRCIELVSLATAVSSSHRDYCDRALCLCFYTCRKNRTSESSLIH